MITKLNMYNIRSLVPQICLKVKPLNFALSFYCTEYNIKCVAGISRVRDKKYIILNSNSILLLTLKTTGFFRCFKWLETGVSWRQLTQSHGHRR